MADSQRLLAVSPNLPNAMHRQNWCIRDYYISKTLYTGYAAAVYAATCKYSGMQVVLKVYSDVHKAPDVAVHEMYREVAIHSGLQHPSVVHLYGAFEEGHMLVLVQEFVPGGDLLGLMTEHGGRCDEATAVETVLRPLLSALLYLHRWGVVHRDVKPENVLFAEDGSIRVIDFGLAINMIEERPISRVGTLDYMAPEVLRCPIKQNMSMAPRPGAPARYGFATDVWAIGIVTYELLTGLPPYASDCRHQAEALICSATPPMFPHSMSPMARDFILRALAPHAGDRPTVRQLLQHPWILDPTGRTAAVPAHPVAAPVPCQGYLHHPHPHAAAPAHAYPAYPASVHSTPTHANTCGVASHAKPHATTTFSSSSTLPYEHAGHAVTSGPSVSTTTAAPAAPDSARSSATTEHVASRVPFAASPSPQPASRYHAPAVVAARTASPVPSPAPHTHAHCQQQQQQQQQQAHALLPAELSEQLRSLQEQQIMDLCKMPLDQLQDMITKLQQAMHIAAAQQQQQQHQQRHSGEVVFGSTVAATPSHAAPSAAASAAASPFSTPVQARGGDVAMTDAHHHLPHHHHHSPFAVAGGLASHILHHASGAVAAAAPSAPCSASCTSGATDGTDGSPYGSRRTTDVAQSPVAAAAAATSPYTDRSSCGGALPAEGDGLVFLSINSMRKTPGLAGAVVPEKSSLDAARDVASWLHNFVAM